MGFRLLIKGQNEEIVLEQESISSAKYYSNTPDDSNSRATDLTVSIELEGKILSEDMTKQLTEWSLLSTGSSNEYRYVTLDVIREGNVIRKITLPNAFVVDYSEEFDNKEGNGKFILLIRQKKEKIKDILVEGGYQYAS